MNNNHKYAWDTLILSPTDLRGNHPSALSGTPITPKQKAKGRATTWRARNGIKIFSQGYTLDIPLGVVFIIL